MFPRAQQVKYLDPHSMTVHYGIKIGDIVIAATTGFVYQLPKEVTITEVYEDWVPFEEEIGE